MEEIRAIIIDDEEGVRESLRTLIELYTPHVNVVAEAGSVGEGLFQLGRHQPSLVFLDVKMGDGTGFDLLDKVNDIDFEVIFTTAHGEFALNAIKASALDYLLKPIDYEELTKAVAKFGTRGKTPDQNEEHLRASVENSKPDGGGVNKVMVATQDEVYFLEVDNIVMLEGDSNYTHVYMNDGAKLTASKVLKEFTDLITVPYFFRCHQSFFVNLKYVTKYIKGRGGELVMRNAQKVPVSRDKKSELLNLLKNS